MEHNELVGDFDRMSDDSLAPNAPNDFSPAAMAPGELFGDRIIACGLWLDCAIASLTQCPAYPKEDCKIDQIVDQMKAFKGALNQQLSRYPAASIQEGTKL